MNATQVWKQSFRLIIAGSMATLIAILAERKLGSWWAGAAFGIPVALLITDIKKTKEAAVCFWDKTMPHIGPFLILALPFALTIFCAAMALMKALALTKDWGGLMGASMCVCSLFAFSAFVDSYICRYEKKTPTDARTLTYLPLTRLFASKRIVKQRGYKRRGEKNVNMIEFIGDVYSRRDAGGKLVRAYRLGQLFVMALGSAVLPIKFWIAGIFGPIMILTDLLATYLMKLLSSESVSVAIGATVGFTLDYFFGPEQLRGALPTTMWLAGCTLLGGSIGSLLWMIKQWLTLWEPEVFIEARRPA